MLPLLVTQEQPVNRKGNESVLAFFTEIFIIF